MNWVTEIYKNRTAANLINDFLEQFGTDELVKILQEYMDSQKQYFCKTRTSVFSVKIADILYLEISEHTISIHTQTQIYTKYGSLSQEYERLKPYGFIKCNQSVLVSLSRIQSIEKNSVLLENGKKIHVSRNYAKNLISEYMAYRFHQNV